MERFVTRISGYAGASKSEYIAESFVSWMRREGRIDPRLQEFLDRLAKKRATDHVLAETRGRKPSLAKPQSGKILRSKEGIAADMERLHELEGEAYWKQLKAITERKEFKRVKKGIFSAAGESDPDYKNLLDAANKAVEQGFKSFILPNPKGFRSADLILERKGFYRMYDVKTITGKTSVGNRLKESIGQSQRVILSINTDINPRILASDITTFFEQSDAKEVMIYKGGKMLVINREYALSRDFMVRFRKAFIK